MDKIQRKVLESKIAGALKDTINVHGPITKVNLGSAIKRIIGTIKNLLVIKENK